MRQRVFISYTMRDNELTLEILARLKKTLQRLEVDTFIDLIDNRISQKHQKKLYKWLISADYLYLIETTGTYHSPWVKKELDIANRLNIPIIKIPLSDIEHFIVPSIATSKIKDTYEHTVAVS
ncbi:TIR domain-containing protein [Intestinimonas massiliensis (ex Afouda et al. 2020)]|uniref:TIR domain-containing protein n=1 Tax=Intestinimonas massiliensis (ex Afouda et al. 2020) TaxID=1673721 RepID=UPI001030479F|nr:TIR domain-containing protein [Intestinimonas massiliensis (ex Afouda et al. 2020)]